MAIGPVVTQGFGSFGSVNLVVTLGYGIGEAAATPTHIGVHYEPLHRKPHYEPTHSKLHYEPLHRPLHWEAKENNR